MTSGALTARLRSAKHFIINNMRILLRCWFFSLREILEELRTKLCLEICLDQVKISGPWISNHHLRRVR